MNDMNTPKAIICVDDDKTILSALRFQLGKILGNQIIIEIAENGFEAIEIIEELIEEGIQIPILVSDQIMPEMQGHELVEKVGNQFPEIMCIILTGYIEPMENEKLVEQSQNLLAVINKPWDEKQLIELITPYYKA